MAEVRPVAVSADAAGTMAMVLKRKPRREATLSSGSLGGGFSPNGVFSFFIVHLGLLSPGMVGVQRSAHRGIVDLYHSQFCTQLNLTTLTLLMFRRCAHLTPARFRLLTVAAGAWC